MQRVLERMVEEIEEIERTGGGSAGEAGLTAERIVELNALGYLRG